MNRFGFHGQASWLVIGWIGLHHLVAPGLPCRSASTPCSQSGAVSRRMGRAPLVGTTTSSTWTPAPAPAVRPIFPRNTGRSSCPPRELDATRSLGHPSRHGSRGRAGLSGRDVKVGANRGRWCGFGRPDFARGSRKRVSRKRKTDQNDNSPDSEHGIKPDG